MSQTRSNYQHIFSVALQSYKKRTGNDLTSNPLLPRLETCNSPDAVIALLREQIPGFDQSRSVNDSERLSKWSNQRRERHGCVFRDNQRACWPGRSQGVPLNFIQNLDADPRSLGIHTREADLYGHRNFSLSESLRPHQYHILRFVILCEKFSKTNVRL
jgi:hypothetical protein